LQHCTGGYKGRLGLHELMIGLDSVKALIQERARVANLLATALEEGMRTLRQDGIEKVLAGLTDLKQVQGVYPLLAAPARQCSQLKPPYMPNAGAA
jgi:type II secretory ATPase GspE/PulE/Tfp pilus assembly ATPase PilB-like protein